MYRSFFTSATRLPSGPSTTSARASSRDWMPYEAVRRYEWTVGSAPCTPTKLPSLAYWPAEAPTCHEASTEATPARTRPSEEVVGAATTSAAATATDSRAIERKQARNGIPPSSTRCPKGRAERWFITRLGG